MIYAAALPIEKYSVQISEHQYVGLYDSYGHQPALLALVMIGSLVPYDYEGAQPDPMLRRMALNHIDYYEQTLTFKINGVTVEEHLQGLNPLEFYDLITSHDITGLPVLEVMGGQPGTFRLCVGARAAAWAVNYRGKLRSHGKIIEAVFNGIPVSEELKKSDKSLKEYMRNDNASKVQISK